MRKRAGTRRRFGGAAVAIVLGAAAGRAQESAMGLGLDEVPCAGVELGEGLWKERARTVARESLPALFAAAEERGLLRNFELAAGTGEGEHTGGLTDDALVYQLLEAAAYSLHAFPDDALAARVDAVVAAIAAAQREDGYVGTYFTAASPGRPWRDLADGRELFCAGHLIEAAVALAGAAQKPELLAVAVRLADAIDARFDPTNAANRGKVLEVEPPGFPEIELALLRLARHTGEFRYQERAEAFVEARGRKLQRKLMGERALDDIPLLKKKLAAGHAASAMNLYGAVAELARRTAYEDLYVNALTHFDDVYRRKLSLVGGPGLAARGDAFGPAHELPLDDAGSELAACAGFARWSHSLFLLSKHAVHSSAMERALHNAVLGGLSLDGRSFAARAPLASEDGAMRAPGLEHGLAAAELCRTIASVPGRVWARGEGALYVSMYVPSTIAIPGERGELRVTMETDYPRSGKVAIRFDTAWKRKLALHVLVPAWCTRGVTLGVNEPIQTVTVEHGHDPGTFLVFEREWDPGDVFLVELPLVPERVRAPEEVEACRGRVALRRGPDVYAFEERDQPRPLASLYLPPDAELREEWRADLLGGVHAIVAKGLALVRREGQVVPEPVELVAIPYRHWGERGPGAMQVWIPESAELCAPAE